MCDELCQSAESRAGRCGDRRRTPQKFFKSRPMCSPSSHSAIARMVWSSLPKRRARTLADLQLPAKPLVAVLEGLEKPGNVGAILRSADAAGVDAVIVADGRTDLYNPNTIRASLGTVFRHNICEATSADTIAWLRRQNLPIIAARPMPQHALHRGRSARRRRDRPGKRSSRPQRCLERQPASQPCGFRCTASPIASMSRPPPPCCSTKPRGDTWRRSTDSNSRVTWR